MSWLPILYTQDVKNFMLTTKNLRFLKQQLFLTFLLYLCIFCYVTDLFYLYSDIIFLVNILEINLTKITQLQRC